jgi:DNA repair protein RadC
MAHVNLYELKKNKTEFQKTQIKSSLDAADFIRQFYSDDIGIYESFFILLLNNSNKTVGYAKISQGGIVGTVVDVKIIAKYVVDSLATGVILAHNHPSGTLIPSQPDKDITKKVTEVLKHFDCKVLDHVILTEESHYSFLDNGNL